MRRSPGFSVLDVLIAAGISVGIVAALVLLLRQALAGAQAAALHRQGYAAVEDLGDAWDAQAASAFAIFVPARDVLGGENGDGHEVDFFTRDAQGHPLFWAYRFDAAGHALRRYAYAAPGAAASADGEALTGVRSFAATTVAVNAFAEPLFQARPATPVSENLGYPGVDGGNDVTELHLVTADDDLTADLLPGIAPSGFSVVVGTFTPAPAPPPAPAPQPSPTPLAVSVPETLFVNQYRPCKPAQFYVATQPAAQGTIQAILAGQVAGYRGPGNMWWNDVTLRLGELEQLGVAPSQPVDVSYAVDHLCNDLALP